MRGDIPPGMQAAQLVHAAGETGDRELPDGVFAIALEAADESSLLKVSERLSSAGVRHRVIHEVDAPYSGQAMAIGVYPGRRDRLRPHFSQLPLVGRRAPKRGDG